MAVRLPKRARRTLPFEQTAYAPPPQRLLPGTLRSPYRCLDAARAIPNASIPLRSALVSRSHCWIDSPHEQHRPKAYGSSHQTIGLVKGPFLSASVSGNWLALSGPRRSGLYQEAALYKVKLRFRLGSNTPTLFPSLVFDILIGSSRSESFEITTAIS